MDHCGGIVGTIADPLRNKALTNDVGIKGFCHHAGENDVWTVVFAIIWGGKLSKIQTFVAEADPELVMTISNATGSHTRCGGSQI